MPILVPFGKVRLGIAIYYCKIVERELTSKLVEPFLKTKPTFSPDERGLKDFRRCLETGRLPGLGSIAHGLTVTARPNRPDDTPLTQCWRSFLTNLAEPQRSSLRSREFIGTLKILADVRNRVAHLGDLTEEEFQCVEAAVLQEGGPGDVLKVLGIL